MVSTAPLPTTPEACAVTLSAQASPALEGRSLIEPAQRHAMIAEAAFFKAQARSFTPCQEIDDWLAAEREVEQRLSKPDH